MSMDGSVFPQVPRTQMQIQEDNLRLTGIRRRLIPCQESAAKLEKLLLDNDFPSGTHLDFFPA